MNLSSDLQSDWSQIPISNLKDPKKRIPSIFAHCLQLCAIIFIFIIRQQFHLANLNIFTGQP